MRRRQVVAGLWSACCGGLAASGAAFAQQTPYNYTTYQVAPTAISYITCGQTSQDSGCFGSGSFGPFGHVCAVLSSAAATRGDTATQDIYVMDSGQDPAGSVHLVIYKKAVVTGTSSITTTFKRMRDLKLPLAGGSGVTCQAAANDAVIAAGTNTSTNAAIITKAPLQVTSIGGFSPPETVASITANADGYIAIDFTDGFLLLNAAGVDVSFGGGTISVFPGDNAFIP